MTTNVSPAVLQPGAQLTTVAATYVTGPSNSQTVFKRAVFSNITNAAVTITVWLVPAGGAAGNANQIISARSIAPFGTDLGPELTNLVLYAGDTIVALASANTAVNMFASGFVAS